MNKTLVSKYLQEFFGNKFILRFLIWLIGIGIFTFGINFVIHSGVGQDTYDAFFNPIRILLGVSIKNFGLAILLPGGTILIIIASALYYFRTKKFRADYILAVIPLVFSGFLIDLIGKLDFFAEMNFNSWVKSNIVFNDFPMHILWIFIGIPMMYLGIGIFSGVRIMPNPYAMLVLELSIKLNKKFSLVQLFVDLAFAFSGLIVLIICAGVGRISGGIETTWYDILKIISLGTLIAFATQGLIVGKSIMFLEKLFGYKLHA